MGHAVGIEPRLAFRVFSCGNEGMKVRDGLYRLDRDGWVVVRTRGDHRRLKHSAKAGTVTVAGHPSDDVHPMTRASIWRQARLEDEP